jgi:hypothetical protein
VPAGKGGWSSTSGHWVDGVFGKQLGEPDPATYDPAAASWKRTFKGGTVVTFNAETNTGRILWGSQATSPPPPPLDFTTFESSFLPAWKPRLSAT